MIGLEEIESVRILKPEPGDLIYIRLRKNLPKEELELVIRNVGQFFQERKLKVIFDERGDLEEISVIRPPKEATNA